MVVVRWTGGCHRLFHGKSGNGNLHHRHSLCQTAFQNGRTVARAIREGRGTTYIKDNGKIQRRYIRRPTRPGRFLRHMVPAMQDDAPHPGAGERSVG